MMMRGPNRIQSSAVFVLLLLSHSAYSANPSNSADCPDLQQAIQGSMPVIRAPYEEFPALATCANWVNRTDKGSAYYQARACLCGSAVGFWDGFSLLPNTVRAVVRDTKQTREVITEFLSHPVDQISKAWDESSRQSFNQEHEHPNAQSALKCRNFMEWLGGIGFATGVRKLIPRKQLSQEIKDLKEVTEELPADSPLAANLNARMQSMVQEEAFRTAESADMKIVEATTRVNLLSRNIAKEEDPAVRNMLMTELIKTKEKFKEQFDNAAVNNAFLIAKKAHKELDKAGARATIENAKTAARAAASKKYIDRMYKQIFEDSSHFTDRMLELERERGAIAKELESATQGSKAYEALVARQNEVRQKALIAEAQYYASLTNNYRDLASEYKKLAESSGDPAEKAHWLREAENATQFEKDKSRIFQP